MYIVLFKVLSIGQVLPKRSKKLAEVLTKGCKKVGSVRESDSSSAALAHR